jgi:acyl carrier protein
MALLDHVRDLVSRHVDPPADDDPLEVESVVLVAIVEDLEAEFEILVRATDLVPEHFASIQAIAAFVERKASA